MIIRKPYAFLIRHFKLIHIAMFIIMGYLVFRLRNIYMFFKDYVTTGHFTYIASMVNDYINWLMLALVLIILIASILIYFLMRKKGKPVLFYQILLGYSLVLLIMLFIYRNFFISLEQKTYDTVTIVIYRDIIAFLYYINYFYVGFSFVRGFGFDIKKFSFDKDLKELNIKETDNEEYELAVNFDKDNIANSLRREKREFGYYLKENRVILSVIGIVLLIGLGVYLYLYFQVLHKVYPMNTWVIGQGMTFNILDVYVTDKNKYGEVINNQEDFMIVRFKVLNQKNVSQAINDTLRLHLDKEYFYPTTLYNASFDDLGLNYNKQLIKPNEEKEYLLIFKVAKNLSLRKNYLEIVTYKGAKEQKATKIAISLRDETKNENNYQLKDDIVLGNYHFKIDNYQVASSFKYQYKECLTADNCLTYEKNVSSFNHEVLALKMNIDNVDFHNLIENYLSVNYVLNDKNKTISSREVKILASHDQIIYLEVDKNLSKASQITLCLNQRGRLSYINLKGDQNG